MDDAQAAAEIATAVGALLLMVRAEIEGPTLTAEGDALAQRLLAAMLAERFPRDAVLSEEAPDDLARLSADRVWIVDPLDGTREFGEPGREDWAVHVALVERGELVAGAVAMPALRMVYDSATVAPVASALPARPRALVSRTRRPAPVLAMAAALDAELIEMGSAGAKAMAVVRGDAEIYAHAGGQYEWDSAAPVAVARAAGLHVSRIDGSPLVYNRENPWLPDVLICRPELAQRALTALAQEAQA